MYKTILIPLDGSTRAETILPHAISLAHRYDAELVLLKVDEPELMLGRDEVVDAEGYLEKRRRERTATLGYLESVAGRLRSESIRVNTVIAYGSAVRAIADAAAEAGADLVAMSSHGIGGSTRQFYGSTTAGVLQKIDRPLLVVRNRRAE